MKIPKDRPIESKIRRGDTKTEELMLQRNGDITKGIQHRRSNENNKRNTPIGFVERERERRERTWEWIFAGSGIADAIHNWQLS